MRKRLMGIIKIMLERKTTPKSIRARLLLLKKKI